MSIGETPPAPGPVEMLLLLTPPNSGSTSMADFMAQSPQVGGLQRRYEGQWLVDHLHEKDRWNDQKPCDYEMIGKVWREAADATMQKHPEVIYLIEKSPPNMVRYREILALFDRTRVVINNRDPYASVSSLGYRYHGFDELDRAQRLERVESLAERWIGCARMLKRIAEREGYPMIRYEEFCEAPEAIFQKFGLSETGSAGADRNYLVNVKDYPSQPIRNMNEDQISKLSTEEIERIGKTLSTDADVVRFFGYEIRPG
ncbi:sulfotransferase [Bauldia litoralis]|uniref:Sulfotransferase family protein n=1 Tax=Bauldia litoralis TaxID=665467 RepID=A0A1G6DSN2_9HYPH|nr:sulfotransferase [Bauldia litoralis]SDB48102.1 Sulfotransferase family protein [Bauldia litoralis]